jgi:hypothetical protein
VLIKVAAPASCLFVPQRHKGCGGWNIVQCAWPRPRRSTVRLSGWPMVNSSRCGTRVTAAGSSLLLDRVGCGPPRSAI